MATLPCKSGMFATVQAFSMVNLLMEAADLANSDCEHSTIHLHVSKLVFVRPLRFGGEPTWTHTDGQRPGMGLIPTEKHKPGGGGGGLAEMVSWAYPHGSPALAEDQRTRGPCFGHDGLLILFNPI